jgi:chitodextrinase
MERGFRSTDFGRSVGSKWSLGLALAALLSLSLALPAQAATGSLDQSQEITNSLFSASLMAQTFTAGVTGPLDKVRLAADSTGVVMTIQIQSVAGAAPSGTVLGTTSYNTALQGSLPCCSRFHDFAFTPAVPITAGTQYAIVVKVILGRLSWRDSGGTDGYTRGELYWSLSSSNVHWVTDTRNLDFAFETYVVAGNINQAPTVAADNSTVTVNEGTAPANTGSFSDADGDTVALTASAGTVAGSSNGTWSWTQPASDEGSSQTITITADDGHGLNSTTSFTATSTGVKPTVAISSANPGLSAAALSSSVPASIPEGTAVTLNGSASSPSADDIAAGFAYSWTVTKNGVSFGSGNAAAFSFTPDDEGTFVATLLAKDDGGMTGMAAVTFTGANVAPSAKIASITWTPQLVLVAHESVNFTGSFSDPGALDTHTATWNFGDGATSTGFSSVHSYSAAGAYTVTFTVTDDDGGVGQSTATVTVLTTQQALGRISATVQGITSLNAGQRNSLIAKLNAASASGTRGDTTASNNQLNAFLNELQADLNTARISTGDAKTLRDAVHALQAALGTYNRFLQWWPLGA